MTQLTQEEKIDYIYNSIKRDTRNKRIKLFIKILLFGFILYFYYFFITQVDRNILLEKFTNIISEITLSVSSDMIDTLNTQSGSIGDDGKFQITEESIQNIIKNNPDLLESLKN